MRRQHPSGGKAGGQERKSKNWVLTSGLRNDTWLLKIAIPGENYSIIIFKESVTNTFLHWYINLEDKAKRNGFYVDYTDLILDLIIEPNLKDWHWDDEDELKEAVDLGLISEEQSRALYKKGAEIRDLIMSGKSIFNGWEKWRPDPNWKVPVLPEGWDVV